MTPIAKGAVASDPLATPVAQAFLRDVDGVLSLASAETTDGAELALAPDLQEVVYGIRKLLTVAETASATGVKDRQVHHWAAGRHFPSGQTRDRLLALHTIASQLLAIVGSDRAKVWLFSPPDDRPFDRLVDSDYKSVLAGARSLAGVHPRSAGSDYDLIVLAKQGDRTAYDQIVRRYYGFVRLKASSYFLAGGDSDYLLQEALVGLYKAVRDYRFDRESSFRNFAELCITRQVIQAVKNATRDKGTLLNQYVSFSATPKGADTLGETIVDEVISTDELESLIGCVSGALSELESRILALYLEGRPYEEVAMRLGCDTMTVDVALARVRRKVATRLVPSHA